MFKRKQKRNTMLELADDVIRLEAELHKMTASNIEKSRELNDKECMISELRLNLCKKNHSHAIEVEEYQKKYAELLERYITLMERVVRLDDRREAD